MFFFIRATPDTKPLTPLQTAVSIAPQCARGCLVTDGTSIGPIGLDGDHGLNFFGECFTELRE